MSTQLVALANADISIDNILGELDTHGGVIVSSLASAENVDDILSELDTYIKRTHTGRDTFSGELTTRTGALIARSEAVRRTAISPLILDVANTFLRPYCDQIQLMLTQIIRLLPKQGRQFLHRDRMVWGKHLDGIEPQLNTLWALTDFTAENGATRVVPGSHKWDLDRKPKSHEITQAVMSVGSVLIFTGSVIHGGGKNNSKNPRVGLNLDYCLGWLRQEENQYLSCPPDIARKLSPEIQELIGYSMPNYALGYFTPPGATDVGVLGVLAPEMALGREPHDIEENRYLKLPDA